MYVGTLWYVCVPLFRCISINMFVFFERGGWWYITYIHTYINGVFVMRCYLYEMYLLWYMVFVHDTMMVRRRWEENGNVKNIIVIESVY